MKKVVRIAAFAVVAAASYSSLSTPVAANPLKQGTTLSEGAGPRPVCPVSICGSGGFSR
ncbi:MAG TPA: hypothetical protein VNR20_05385 [Terriglobales bacterium]|nr:hypothetical protein [Terriglobales bacterium]